MTEWQCTHDPVASDIAHPGFPPQTPARRACSSRGAAAKALRTAVPDGLEPGNVPNGVRPDRNVLCLHRGRRGIAGMTTPRFLRLL